MSTTSRRATSAAGPVEGEPGAPRRVAAARDQGRRVGAEIVAFRAEVVVDDVEHHRDAVRVRGIDQRLEVLGAPVAGMRREEQHPVVAPAAAAGERGHRHQLDRRHAQGGEVGSRSAAAWNVPAAVNVPTCSS